MQNAELTQAGPSFGSSKYFTNQITLCFSDTISDCFILRVCLQIHCFRVFCQFCITQECFMSHQCLKIEMTELTCLPIGQLA